MNRPTLDEIARGTQPGKSGALLGYSHVYDLLLRDRRDSVKTVLEIGVLKGASLAMWERYFPNANIYGIDIHTYPEHPGGVWRERVRTFEADQSNPEDLRRVANAIGLSIDFVSDDGSHKTSDQLTSLETLFPFLSPGGIYVIEDIQAIGDIKPFLSRYNHFFAIPNTEEKGSIMCIIQK